MRITVGDGDKIVSEELSGNCTLETLTTMMIANLEKYTHCSSGVRLLKDGTDILATDRWKTITDCGLSDGDFLHYSYAPASYSSTDQSSVKTMKHSNNKTKKKEKREEKWTCSRLFKEMKNAITKSKIYFAWKPLHDQFINNPTDYDGFKDEYVAYMRAEKIKEELMSDPTSVEGQKLILQQIRLDNCNLLYQEAHRKIPEAFDTSLLSMLCIRVVVNGVPTIAWIDSGACASFMDSAFVKRANLERMVDSRSRQVVLSGIGGPEKPNGCIFSCALDIDSTKLNAKLNVGNHIFDVLLGLDFLRFHRGYIDLPKNRLVFNESIHAEFLSATEVSEWQCQASLTENRKLESASSVFKVDNDKLAELVGMGFDRKEARRQLEHTLNDVPDAVRSLYYWADHKYEPIEEAVEARETDFDEMKEDKESVSLSESTATDTVQHPTSEDSRTIYAEITEEYLLEKLNALMSDGSVEEEEKKCRNLFEEMSEAKTKCEMYFAWKPLHDHFIKHASDYDGFKREHELYMASERNNLAMMNDPVSADGQKLIQKKIVEANLDKIKKEAKEMMPGVFDVTRMLYVRIVVNGVPSIAFVDTGACRSTFALAFAKNADFEHRIDFRNREARMGFGGCVRTIGIIWFCSVEINGSNYDAKVDVLNDNLNLDMIIGLDFLRRHKCCIDLQNNKLVFNENMHVDFLSDEEIAEWNQGRNEPPNSFKVDEDMLTELLEMGFDRKYAEIVLKRTLNDLDDSVRCLYKKAERAEENAATAEKGVNEFSKDPNTMDE